jgi:Fur family peroxide stress response transcriptional regulator
LKSPLDTGIYILYSSYIGINSYLGSIVKASRQEIERRMARFEQVCRDAGIRLTHQRMEIFREVARTGDHPGAESVFQGVRKRMPTISLDTVYRALWLLTDLGLITTLGPPRGGTRFDANLTPHQHFACVRCGVTRDFYSDALNELSLPESAKALGQVQTAHVEVRGVCQECGRKESKPNRSTKQEAER